MTAPLTTEDLKRLLERCNRLEAELKDVRNTIRQYARQTIHAHNSDQKVRTIERKQA